MSFSGFKVLWVELEGVLVEQAGSFVDQVGLNMMRLEEYDSFREASEEARYLEAVLMPGVSVTLIDEKKKEQQS